MLTGLGSQHRLFNEHLVSASSNPALALRRKKHTEKEVLADLVSTVSVRLREGYSVREVTLAKGKGLGPAVSHKSEQSRRHTCTVHERVSQ